MEVMKSLSRFTPQFIYQHYLWSNLLNIPKSQIQPCHFPIIIESGVGCWITFIIYPSKAFLSSFYRLSFNLFYLKSNFFCISSFLSRIRKAKYTFLFLTWIKLLISFLILFDFYSLLYLLDFFFPFQLCFILYFSILVDSSSILKQLNLQHTNLSRTEFVVEYQTNSDLQGRCKAGTWWTKNKNFTNVFIFTVLVFFCKQ